MENNFMIFDINELSKIDFDEVLETSFETLRKSVDRQKTFVQWSGSIPKCVEALTTKEGPYNYDEMLEILTQENWYEPFPFLSKLYTLK